jgi:hypothetical protein
LTLCSSMGLEVVSVRRLIDNESPVEPPGSS